MVGEAQASLICLSRHPPPRLGADKELDLPRATLARLVEARTGHGDFASYVDRFNLNGLTSCGCGEDKEPDHFWKCPMAWQVWKGVSRKNINFPVRGKKDQIKWMLGQPKGAEAFA